MNDLQKEFLETANYLGAIICRDALWADERCSWLGPSMEYTGNAWTAVQKAYGPDLYSGTSGIAVFLGHLYSATNERIYRLVAEGAIKHCLSRLDDLQPTVRSAFYSGWTGAAYALCNLAPILDRPDYIVEALRLTEGIAGEDPNQQGLDVISGSAGAIPALLNMRRHLNKDSLLDLAIKHGDHLLATARKSEMGWSWDTMNAPRDLTGFSHGTAGIAWACLELFSETRERRFREAAEQAFQYERYWFNSEQENWPDFRTFGSTTPAGEASLNYSLAWCHGAPGIGLSRLRAYELSGDELYRTEAESALRTTSKMLSSSAYTEQNNLSLCHGLTGNADLLIYASEIARDNDSLNLVQQIGEQGIARYRKNNLPWPCGVPGAGEAPNLMLGLAGIGYFYLRLCDPKKHRSLLIVFPEGGGRKRNEQAGAKRRTKPLT